MSWEEIELNSIAQIIAGQSPKSSFYNEDGKGLPFFQGNADFGVLTPKVRTYTSQVTKISTPNDLLISVRAPVGALNINNIKCCIGRGLAAIRASDGLNVKYLYYFLSQYKNKLKEIANGAVFEAVTTEQLKRIKIPLPPLPIQEKIANILDRADQLRRKDQELHAKYAGLAQAIFVNMFGDPIRNEKRWEVKNLEEYILFLTSGSRGWAKYYREVGDVFLRIQNIGYNELKIDNLTYVNAPTNAEAKRTQVRAKDLILTITADLGRSAVIPEELDKAYINQHLAILRLNQNFIDPYYLSAYFSSSKGKQIFDKLNKGGVKAGLNFNDIKNIPISVPPLSLQQQYTKKINLINKLKEKAKANVKASESLFQSTLQRAFKGELVN